MMEFLGMLLIVLGLFAAIGIGLYVAWRKGKLTQFEFLPRPPKKEGET